MPIVAAVMKEVESGMLTLETPVVIGPADVDLNFGPLGNEAVNKQYTIEQLTYLTIYYSDNTAAKALLRTLNNDSYPEAMFGLGLKIQTYRDFTNMKFPLSPKEYSNIFRSLYYSSYLSRESSETLLRLLTNTSFNEGLPSGVPPGILVAHKIGFLSDATNYEHHDCGIIYYPQNPFILCIMTRGMTYPKSNAFIANLTNITYTFVDMIQKTPPVKLRD